jgi:3-hydroxyisobutyrate dehydrogenase-like beta-hydroxyacid dehydrogenase
MCCVGNDNDLRAVTIGADGAFAGMKKGAVFVDHTTASAEVARELDAEAKKAASSSSMRRCRAARPAPRTACSP